MKKRYGSIGGDLLNNLFNFYTENKEEFNLRLGEFIEEVGTKGCFLYEDKEDYSKSYIIFGLKYINTKENRIDIKGSIIARGLLCGYKVGDKLSPSDIYKVNSFIMLDSAGLVTKISDLELITTETESESIK